MKPVLRMLLGLRDQVLAAAEADLEADALDAVAETAAPRSAGGGALEIERERGSSVSNSAACCGRSA